MNKEEKTLFLVDAYAMIFRAYYAFIRNPRYNSKGLNTSAIFGFTNILLEILEKENPSHIAVVFDPPGPTFRNEIYSEYKANREATPEDIKLSVPYIKKIIEGFNIPIFEIPGFEADDVIGTMAKNAEKENYKIYMLTPDKDYGQFISENILQYKPGRAGNPPQIIGVEEIKAIYGIDDPIKIIDIMALAGDSADNIPGAKGVGEKTAIKLIEEFGSVENVLNNIVNLKGKLKENIETSKDNILLSKELVTLSLDVPVEIDENKLRIKTYNEGALKSVFDELEFRAIVKRVFQTKNEQPQAVQTTLFDVPHGTSQEDKVKDLNTIKDITHNYILVDTNESINSLVHNLLEQKEFCFDTETTGLNVYTSELVGIAISYKEHEAYYIPFSHSQNEAQKRLNLLIPALTSNNIRKIGQNLKYDILILKSCGIDVQGEIFDTMIAHYLLRPELRHNMDFLAEKYLQYSPIKIEELIGPKGKNQASMRSVPLDKIKEYACEDADITYQLYKKIRKEIDEANIQQLVYNIEMPLVNVLARMESNGVKLDINALANYEKELKKELLSVENEIFKLAREDFNISSPKQLGEILFEKLKIVDKAKKTKTKQYSTSEDVLEKIKDKHEIIPIVLEYRSLKKLLSTYIEALPKLINAKSGMIHTSFDQAWVATGRLSSKNPNLQNIPVREERGREIRKSFIPRKSDNVLLSADYSQIELRLMAHMSEDGNMINAFKNNEDIHASTAAKIYNVGLTDVSKEMRSHAKTANFGIIYGITDFGLSQRLNIPREDAKALIEGYFKAFPRVSQFMMEAIQKCKEKGYVETLLGRKRYLPDINSMNTVVRGFAERNAINAPIQGTAADIIKIAMVNIDKYVREKNLKSKMILQVHDELVFDVEQKELEEMQEIVKRNMEMAYSLKVPLVVDMGTGNNWIEAH